MKYYYLNKPKLINEEIQVLKVSGIILADENADALFGIGGWVCYYGPKLPARMKFDVAKDKIVVLTDDAPKKHLYAGVGLLKNVVTQDQFDPAMFVNNNDLNFLVPIKFGGSPAFTYPNKSFFMTFKLDGTPVSDLMKVISDNVMQITPNNIDALISRNLTVAENNTVNGVNRGIADVIAGSGSNEVSLKKLRDQVTSEITNINNRLNQTINALNANARYCTPIGTIAAFIGGNIPTGWVPCDGRYIPRNNQTSRFYTIYPNGYLPDLRNEFLRGWGSVGAGGRQTDAGRNVTGSFGYAVEEGGFANGAFVLGSTGWPGGPGSHVDHSVSIDASRVWGAEHTAGEFRPRNVSVYWCMLVYDYSNIVPVQYMNRQYTFG